MAYYPISMNQVNQIFQLHRQGISIKRIASILSISKNGILVAAGEESVLKLIEVQPENRQRMTAHDFAIGHRIRPGMLFS